MVPLNIMSEAIMLQQRKIRIQEEADMIKSDMKQVYGSIVEQHTCLLAAKEASDDGSGLCTLLVAKIINLENLLLRASGHFEAIVGNLEPPYI